MRAAGFSVAPGQKEMVGHMLGKSAPDERTLREEDQSSEPRIISFPGSLRVS